MDRRLFLKSAVTTCGLVVVGVPNISVGESPLRVRSATPAGAGRYLGDKRAGCAIPSYQRNQHDLFPQDLHRLRP